MADPVPLLESLHPFRQPPVFEAITPVVVMMILGLLTGALCAGVAMLVMRRLRRVRRAAQIELALSRELSPVERLAAQALLLRRLVKTTTIEDGARACGDVWLERLDRTFATTYFSQGEGRAFGNALYSPETRPDVEALDRTLSGFIAKVKR